VDSPISFTGGAQRVCFYRQSDSQGAYDFVSASAEGGDERILAKGKSLYPYAVACTPDGRHAAFAGNQGNVETVDFASGLKQTWISAAVLGGWLQEMRWAPDAQHLTAFSADGKSVFYTTSTPAGTTISEQPLDTLAPLTVATLPGKFVKIQEPPDGTKLGLVIRTPQTKAVLLRETH
jgi:Tol biopolymer transport system component